MRLHRARVAPENNGTWQEWPQEAQGLVAEVAAELGGKADLVVVDPRPAVGGPGWPLLAGA